MPTSAILKFKLKWTHDGSKMDCDTNILPINYLIGFCLYITFPTVNLLLLFQVWKLHVNCREFGNQRKIQKRK